MMTSLARIVRRTAPSFLSEAKILAASGRQVLRKGRFWQWRRSDALLPDAPYRLVYTGTPDSREWAAAALHSRIAPPSPRDFTVVASEWPLPGSLRVPRYVTMDVPLAPSLEQILDDYGEKLRRVVLQQLPRAELVEARTDDEIASADRLMLQPYAIVRHGPTAAQLPLATVTRVARPPYGRLDILKMDGEPVACHLGALSTYRGRKVWTAVRFGYVEQVFANSKRLHEVNSTNVFLATKHAKEMGASFYSLGMTLAQPDNGLLHWKRRRGGALNASGNTEWLYVRAPARDAATFFWSRPLFAAGWGKRLSLHVGVPAGIDEAAALDRYREMHFTGLRDITIHHDPSVPEALIERVEQKLRESDPRLPITRARSRA